MCYQVGNIGIRICESSLDWTRRAYRVINRQLDGFQTQNGFDDSVSYWLNLYDYATLPTALLNEIQFMVPEYCYYSAGVYVDTQQKIAVEVEDQTLNVWCSIGYRNMSIPFLLQHLLLMQRKSFVHAAAVSINDNGVLLPAFGGVGKTSFIAQAVRERGVQLLGDDMIIVTDEGRLEPYLRPFALYEYHKVLFPEFFSEHRIDYKPLTLGWRIYNKCRTILSSKLGLNWQQSEHIVRTGYLPVAPTRVLPQSVLAQTSVKLDQIYLLQRSTATSTMIVKPLDTEQAINFMINVMYHEWHSQLRFLLSWLTHRSISMVSHLAEMSAILHAAASDVQLIRLVLIPAQMPPATIAKELTRRVVQ